MNNLKRIILLKGKILLLSKNSLKGRVVNLMEDLGYMILFTVETKIDGIN
jgi:hypothetical protein